jgi:hypothetical protein
MTQGKTITSYWFRAIAVAAFVMIPSLSAAQTTVTSADIQRLQDDIYQAHSDLSRLRSTDSNTFARLQDELDDLRDEVIYLKVRLRKEGRVPQTEYLDVRDRIAAIRARARGESGSVSGERRGTWQPPAGGVSGGVPGDDRRTQSGSGVIPVGQEIDVRLQTELSSATAQIEDRFEATTVVDVYRGNEVLIPAGSVLRGVVRTVDKATRTDRKGQLTVSFDQITVRGRVYPMRGTVSQALESEGIKGEAARIGTGSAVGAIIGGIIGGVKGALLGVLIGGGGTIAATEGKDVTLPAGTILRVRLDTPPNVR